jgi:hypothetical protein
VFAFLISATRKSARSALTPSADRLAPAPAAFVDRGPELGVGRTVAGPVCA